MDFGFSEEQEMLRASARKFFEETKPQNHKPFEMWAVSLVKGEPIEKKGGDKGIDGRLRFYDPGGKSRYAMIQVKGGQFTRLEPPTGYICNGAYVAA